MGSSLRFVREQFGPDVRHDLSRVQACVWSLVGAFRASQARAIAFLFCMCLIGMSMFARGAWATDVAPTLPDTGVDLAGFVTAAITAIGAIVLVVVGGYAAFLLIKKGMRWMGRALG